MGEPNNLWGNIEPICIRVQKILPTVYTDALSYQDAMGQIIVKTNELVSQVNNLYDQVLAAAKLYTDGEIAKSIERYNQALQQFTVEYEQFEVSVTSVLSGFQNQMDVNFQRQDTEIAGNRAYTDEMIERNNKYLLEQIDQQVISARVLNPFTGERVSIQSMIDYLSTFHMTDAANVQEIANANKTVNEAIDFHATCSQLVINSRAIFNI